MGKENTYEKKKDWQTKFMPKGAKEKREKKPSILVTAT